MSDMYIPCLMPIKEGDLVRVMVQDGQPVAIGSDGAGDAVKIVDIGTMWYVSSSGEELVGGEWTDKQPVMCDVGYVWKKSVLSHGDGTVTESEPELENAAKGEDAVLLRIDSSRGTVFKNNAISTVLRAVIYKGAERIADIDKLHEVFGNGAYLQWSWQKIDENEFGTILATDKMVGNDGFTLTISADEVDTKVTFLCELKE